LREEAVLKRCWVVGPHLKGAPLWQAYVTALGLFAVTLLVRLQLRPVLGDESPLLAFVFPVLFAACICGRGPALALTLLTPLACTPIFQSQFTWSEPFGWIAHVLFFAVVSTLAVVLIHRLQAAHREVQISEAKVRLAMNAANMRVIDWALPALDDVSNDQLAGEGNDAAVVLRDLHPADRAAFLRQLRLHGTGRHPVYVQARTRGAADDDWRCIELVASSEQEGGGEVRIVGVLRDITEQERARQELEKSQLRFKQLADAMPQIVYLLDAERKVVYLNKGWKEYTGHEAAESADVEALIPQEDLQKLLAAWDQSAPQRQPYSLEFRLRSRAGELRWFLRRTAPMLNEDGSVDLWVGTSTDIHDQKQAQLALLEADRRKNEFLAMLAHELRNPLAPIMNISAILDLKAGDSTAVQQMTGILKRQSAHLARLINDLLDVSRITAGKINVERERVILQDVLDRALETVHPMLIAKSQAVKLTVPPRPSALDGDMVRLTQVIGNLLANAAKFSPAQSTIQLTLETDARHASIKVRDQGVGIDGQTLPHIFDLFMQADQSLDRPQGGLGIGLTIAHQLVELHGGSITASSEGIGKGSEFVVRLPLAEAVIARHESAVMNGLSKRILIVDDNKDAALSLLMLLEMQGHEVRVTHDASSCLQQLNEQAADIIFLDIGLPEIDGYMLADIIRRQHSANAPRLVAISGYAPDDAARGEVKFDEYLTKPVQHELLIGALRRLLDGSVTG
jgi:PAS domain S-box-containing protein